MAELFSAAFEELGYCEDTNKNFVTIIELGAMCSNREISRTLITYLISENRTLDNYLKNGFQF